MHVEEYRRSQLARIRQRRTLSLVYFLLAIISLGIPVVGFYVAVTYGSPIIFFSSVAIWTAVLTFLSRLIDKLSLTSRERSLFYLYLTIDNIDEYVRKRKSGNLRKAKRCLRRVKSEFKGIDFDVIGSEWESLLNSFFKKSALYIQIELLPKLRMDAVDETLHGISAEMNYLFEAVGNEEYFDLPEKVQKTSESYDQNKMSLWRRFIPDEVWLKRIYSVLLIVASFSLYWLVTFIFKLDFSFYEALLVTFAIPAAFYYARKLFGD